MVSNSLSLRVLLACLALMLLVFLSYPKWTYQNTQATISWDVSGYYLYLPAIFIYHDLDKLAFAKPLIKEYSATSGYYQSKPLENGNQVIKYSIGWAMVNTPFFLLGHTFALCSAYPADGLSLPYQLSIALGGLFIAFLGFFVLRKLLLRYFSDSVVAGVLVLLVLGTNYLHYTTTDVAMTHNYLFTGYAVLLLWTDNWYRNPRWQTALGIALVLGLMSLMRPTEFLAIVLVLLWPLSGGWSAKLQVFKSKSGQLVLGAATMFLLAMLQFSYWKYTTDHWLYYSYREGFDFLNPYLKEVLFSFRKGWFVYTPLMLFAVAGFFALFRKYPRLFPALFLFFILNLWVVSSWQCWWYGGSFGQRALVQSYVVLAFPLAALLDWILKKRFRLVFFTLPFLFCIALNLFQSWQVRGHGLHPENMTKAYYWRIFFNTDIDPRDKFLMDTQEDFIGTRYAVNRVFQTSFEETTWRSVSDSLVAHKEKFAIFASPEKRNSEKIRIEERELRSYPGSWIRCGAWFYSNWKEWDIWQMAQLEVCFKQDDRCIKYRLIRPQRVLDAKEWKEIWIDVPIPSGHFDSLEIRIIQPQGQTTLYADDLYIEIYSPQEN
ncbi:MAG: hypothetical protein KDC34_10255 [Saprospiraceae bacterium]|nr:hypothetical protein [Saprospiraceae bacterium]